ncbi:MAG TPA: hypothetical protein VGG92_03080 [Caulobacteraceae bacterium]|jgi:hypothetical protein
MGDETKNTGDSGQMGGQSAGQTEGQTGGANQGGEDRSFQSGRNGQGAQGGERIDTDGDGRTRDPNDTRPTADGGRGASVER